MNMYEIIARNLREFGYPSITADYVKEQLELPESERNIIGKFATDMAKEFTE